MAVNNPEWRDAWPTEPEIVLLLKCVANFHRQSIINALDTPIEGEEKAWPTPELDRRIEEAIKKAGRKSAWNKHKAAIRKAAAVAAIIILCLSAFPTVLFALSADFRETVYRYTIDWRKGHADIFIDSKFSAEQHFLKYYRPTLIPEGFILEDYTDDDTIFELHYVNGEQYFYFKTMNISSGTTMDTETATFYFDYRVNGWPAIVRENRGKTTILWHDDVTYFSLKTNLPLDTALSIASSYELGEKF
jgi:hypothetical protein